MNSQPNSNRIERLRNLLTQNDIDAIFISQNENRRYLSGFTGSAGFLFISQDKAILATDFRYVEQAQTEAIAFEIYHTSNGISKWFPTLISSLGVSKLGFEETVVSFSKYQELISAMSEMKAKTSLIPTKGITESLRSVKEKDELKCIEEAAALSDAALEEIIPQIQPGISEKELAWRLESYMRQNGSEAMPFEIIVASGPNSALPHAKPTDKAILENEPIVIDLGARVNGYCSDTTRTICLGEEDSTFNRIYDIVLGAQITATEILQSDTNGEQVDKLARTVIEQAGYGNEFGHGLGHGIGLAAHEEPRLGPGSSDIVTNGMVFTIEPGVYIPGWGGVRIEDTFILEEGKLRPLTKARKIWR